MIVPNLTIQNLTGFLAGSTTPINVEFLMRIGVGDRLDD
jgi:hypothetical protein